jgi:hypothetical protein
MRDIIGHGGGKGGGDSHTHYEAPDSLHSTAYARVLDLVSEGEILGLAEGTQSVYMNGTPVANADGSTNFKNVTIDFRTGTQDQDYIAGFPDVESEVSVGIELKYGTPWVHAITNTSLSAIRITLGVDQMYKADTTNGDVGGTKVDYQIELSTDGGAYQVKLSNSFNGKTMSAYQRTARIDLPPATSGWQIRLTRLTPNSSVVSIVDKTNIISYTEVIDAKLRYPMSAIVGVQIDATQFQSIPTRAYDLYGRIIQVPSNYDGVKRTYTGTWDGTFKPSWSNNPAWVFRDLVLHDRYGLGNRITASQVDKWALYKIARYCDELVPDGKGGTEPRFTCNLYLQSRKQAYAALQDIASIFRGISYWGAGSIIASADMPSDPVYIYTAANVIGGKFNRTGSKKSTRYTVSLVTWNDPDDFYKQKVEYVEDREGIARYGIQQVELTAFGCTSQGQAQRAGRWALATSRLETEGISFDVGMDGAVALPGQVVRVADPSRMGRRVGGRVHAVSGRVVTLDKAPVINVGDQLTVVLPTGTSETHGVAAVSGDNVTIDADWTITPVAQSAWSVDSNELMAPLYRVLSVTEKDEVTFTITAVQHEPGKYDFVENGTAITPRVQTSLDVTKQAAPTSVTLVGYTVSLNDAQKLALQISCAPVPGAVAYEGAYRRGNDNWVAIPRQASPTMDVLDVLAGTYTAKMFAVNSIGVTSVETMSVAVDIARDGASKNATVLLNSDALQFHTTQDGVTDPTVINFTATLIALDGPVSWSCIGGTLSNLTDTTAQLAYADATGASAVVTASVTAFGRTYSQSMTIRKVQDGAAGTDGLLTGIARLYQWAPTTPTKPTGSSTFTWASVSNGTYTGTDDWSTSVSSNSTPGWRLYVASVGVSAAVSASTTSVSYSGASVEAWSLNGVNGANGAQAATATVYQWLATIPAGPSGSPTWTWSSRSFGAAPSGWSLTPGTSPSPGMTLWAASVQIVDSAVSTSTAFSWSSAAVIAVGYAGSKGDQGQQGASYVTAYCASSIGAGTSAPTPTTGKTSLPATGSGGLTGAVYSSTVPTLDATHPYQMQTDGIYDPVTNTITWSTPYQSSLKVATLSAITANLGAINAGSINLGNGVFTVDNDGNLVCHSIKIMNPDGSIMLQAGGQLNPSNAAPGTLNSDLAPSISAAANTAVWSSVTGTGKPQDNATVGANATNFAATIGGDNLINNSGFELYNSSYDPNCPSGFIAYNNANISASYLNITGRLGGRAYGIRANAATNDTFGLRTNTQIIDKDGTIGGVQGGWQPNKTYVVSYKARKVNGAAISDMGLRWNTGPATTTYVSNPVMTTSWQTYSFRFTWGSSVESTGQLYIDHNGTIAANDEIHVDELIVTEGDIFQEWSPSAREAKAMADAAAKSAFSPAVTFDFTNSINGWYGANNTTVTVNPNSVTVTANNSDPQFNVDYVFSGSKYDKIRARIRRVSGSGWDGILFYGNANHGEDGRYFKAVGDPTAGLGTTGWAVVEWDMSTSSNYADWASGNVLHIRLDLGNTFVSGNPSATDSFEIDWIAIGRYGVGSDELASGVASAATTATWAGVSGTGKPADNATAGAPAGTYVGDTPAETVTANSWLGKSASDAIPGINSAIADKLSKTSASSLAATVTLATGGSILSGTTTNGTYQSPSGFYGVQGGVVKFSVPISGDPTFGGQLTAAYGSFGAVDIASGGYVRSGQSAFHTGTGFWLGLSGGVPKFSIGNPGVSSLRWDGSNIILENPQNISSFSATVTNSVNSYYWSVSRNTNGAFAGAYNANPSNGSGNYTYSWSVSSASGLVRGWIGGVTNGQQASLSVYGQGQTGEFDFYLTCIVTDVNANVTKSIMTTVVANFT